MHSLSITHLAVLALAATTVAGHESPTRFQRKRGAHIARDPQFGGITVPGAAQGASTPGVAPAPAPVSTPPAPAPIISIPPILPPAPPPTTQSTVTAPAPVETPSTTATPTITEQPSTTIPRVTVTSSRAPSVINLTLTSIVSASNTPSAVIGAASASASSSSNSGGGGIGKGTVIAIVVAASSVGGVFLLWTVFRRWKLRPRRHFEERLQPVDFSADFKPEKGYSAMQTTTNLNRSRSQNSNGSNGSDRRPFRRDSFGSAAGSLAGRPGERGPGSEVGSLRGIQQPAYPPGSNASPVWSAAPPAPTYSPPQNSAYGGSRLANPYTPEYEYERGFDGYGGMTRSDTVGSGAGRFRDAPDPQWNNHRF